MKVESDRLPSCIEHVRIQQLNRLPTEHKIGSHESDLSQCVLQPHLVRSNCPKQSVVFVRIACGEEERVGRTGSHIVSKSDCPQAIDHRWGAWALLQKRSQRPG